MSTACPGCGCKRIDGGVAHAVRGALLQDDFDRALVLGLLEAPACDGCTAACTAALMAARRIRIDALAARARFRAREARLARRQQARDDRRVGSSPSGNVATSAPALPAAAAAALARAKAKAASRQ